MDQGQSGRGAVAVRTLVEWMKGEDEGVEDAVQKVGEIVFAAFQELRRRSGLPDEYPTLRAAVEEVAALVDHDPTSCFVAVLTTTDNCSELVGFNAVDYTNLILDDDHGDTGQAQAKVVAVGPLAVHPGCQGRGVGRRLMEAAIAQARSRGANSMRITADCHNPAALSLYASLGFETKLTLAVVEVQHGRSSVREGAADVLDDDFTIERMRPEDVDDCARLCKQALGFSRGAELLDIFSQLSQEKPLHPCPLVVRRKQTSDIVGYTTGFHHYGHTLVKEEPQLRFLLGHASQDVSAGVDTSLILVPMERQSGFLCWSAQQGHKLRKTMLLMNLGIYNAVHPEWIYCPSLIY